SFEVYMNRKIFHVRISEKEKKKLFELKKIYQKNAIQIVKEGLEKILINSHFFYPKLKNFLFDFLQKEKTNKNKKVFVYFNKATENLLLHFIKEFKKYIESSSFIIEQIKFLSKIPILKVKYRKDISFWARFIMAFIIENHEKLLTKELIKNINFKEGGEDEFLYY
ncbi:MAG: hypothetical protein QW184_02350, partial [Nanopusillaceae archaeon]